MNLTHLLLYLSLFFALSTQTCNPSASFPPQLTLYTGETFRYYLLDYFNGPSMSFTTSSSLSSYSRIVPSYTQPTTSSNAIPAFVSYKIFKSQDSFYQSYGNSMAFLVKNNTSYYVQAFTPQTNKESIKNLTSAIQLNSTGLPTDAVCYDLAYISIGQVIVDCYSPSKRVNYLVPVSLSAQVMLNNTKSFPEYSSINATIANSMKRNLITVSLNNQIYLLRYTYSKYLPSGSQNTYIAVFNVQPSETQTYGPTIYSFPPITAAAFGQTNFQLQNLVLKGQYLFIYDSSANQIYKTQLTFQGLAIKLPQLGSIKINTTVTVAAMDAFYDGQNYTVIYGLTNSGIYEVDWTTATPYTKYIYPWNSKIVNMNRLVIGQQFIMSFFNNNSTTSVMEVYVRGMVSYPMLQFYNTSFFKQTSILDMDQISGAIYSFGNSYSATNTNQMIQLQLPYLEFKSTAVGSLTNFTFQCQSAYNNQSSAQSSSSFQVQSLQQGQVSITSQSGSTVATQSLEASYPGQAYDDLSRFYKGPGLQYEFNYLNTNPWTPNAKIRNIENYVSQQNFKFILSNGQTLDPSTIIFLKQIQLSSGVYFWFVQDTSNVMYTFLQNYESNEQYIEQYYNNYKWSDRAINIEWLEPWITPFTEGTTCDMYFYNSYSETLFIKNICDSTKYKITYFNLIGNQLYVSINDKNSSSTNRLNGYILTATIKLSNFMSNSAFNLIQWTQFSALQSLTNFYPQIVYQPWRSVNPIVYIQAEQQTIVFNTQYNIIYKTITPASTPYQLSFSKNFLVLIQTSQIEQYQIYNPNNIYKTINYPVYSAYQNTPCYSTSPQGLQFSENLTLVYDKCNSQIVVFAPQKDENQVSQYLIPVTDINFFTLARTYKIPNVISILGKHSFNLINYYEYQFLAINSYMNPQSELASQTYHFEIIVSSVFSNSVAQKIPYLFVNTLDSLYSIHQSPSAQINYGNQFIISSTNQSKASYQISPFSWYKGMIANFSLLCSYKDTNNYQSCGDLASITNTISKNRTISGVPTYFQTLVKGNKFNYAQSKNKLFRIYNYTNNFFDFVQLPFNTRYGGQCYALAVSDNEQFAVSACINGTWRLYITSFLSSEPTVAGSFEIQTPKNAWTINKIIIKDLYVFIVFGGFSLKDGFNYVQILKLNFDQFSTTALHTPITNFTLKSNEIYHGLEYFITSINIQKTQQANTYRFFLTDYLGYLYTHLFTPLTPNAYFSTFLKFHLYYYLEPKIRQVKPILTGFNIFNYDAKTEDTYTGILAFSYYHSYEVTLAFSSTTQAFALTILNQYLQYGIYEFTGNMDVMNNTVNNTDGFVMMFAVLPDRFVNDPNYAGYPNQLLLAYDRSNNSFTASNQTQYNYPQTIITGSYSFQSDEPTFAFLAQVYPGQNASQTNFSVLLINPDTYTLDNLYIKRFIQIDLNTSISDQYWTLSLNAQNSLNLRSYLFSLRQPLSGGGKLSTSQTCAGYQMFNPLTIALQETARFNLLDYFNGPNIAYTTNASNIASIPSFVQNLSSAASQGLIPHYVAYKTYKPWNAFTKEWKQQMAVLYYDYVTSTYAVQQYNVPTANSSMQKVGSPIAFNFYADVICFDLEYMDENTIIVDCHSPTKYLNYFLIISNILTTPTVTYQSSTPYQSLTSPPLHRHLFIFQRSSNLNYIFRCQYSEDYVPADYQLASQTYVEQFSYSNQKISQLFPITASLLSLQSLKIDQLIVDPIGQLFLLTQKVVYKIGPSFLGITLTPSEIDTYTSPYVTNIQRMALNFNGTNLILYLAIQLTDNNFYIQEIDWTTTFAMKLTSRISLNQYLGQVTEMSVSNDFIIMAYNNQNFQNYGSYLDIYSIAQGQNIYQAPFSNKQNFTHDRFNNYLLIFDNTRSASLNKQQMFQISLPYIYLQSQVSSSMQTYSIGCASSYYTINPNQEILNSQIASNSPQASESLMLTIKAQNTVQLTSQTAGVYQALAQSQSPGQGIMNLNQFYTGPSIQYSFQGTGSSATWPTDYKIYSLNTAYQSSSFVFKDKDNNKTISVSDLVFFQQYSMAPDFMFWFIQDKTYNMYMFAEIVVDDNIIQLEPHPVSLQSQLLHIDFADRDVSIVLEQNYNCTLFFYNRKIKALFSQNFCNSSSSASITSFKVIDNILYVMVQNAGNNFVSQTFFNKYNFNNNTAFNWLNWNQLTSTSFLNIQQLTNFVPQYIYQSTLQPNIVILKCSSYVLIFDQFTYHIFGQIPMTTTYQIAVTANDFLTIIQSSKIIEYNFQNALNIFQSKQSYPSYAGTQFSTSNSDIQRTDKFVYIRQSSTSQILVIQPGNSMLSAVQNTIPLTANYQFFSVEKSYDNIFETIAIFGTNSISVYNFYIQKRVEITAQNSQSAGNLTFSIGFQSQFETSASHTLNFTFQQTPNTQMFSIAEQQSATIDYAGFINIETFSGQGIFQFLPHQWYSGVITNYGINCSQSCQNSVNFQAPVGLQRQITKSPYFIDVRKGKSFTYAQSENKVYRLSTYRNQIFDMVPLPFSTQSKKCYKLSIAPTEYYSLSACYDDDTWSIYMVSYLSSEPHVAGSFKAPYIQSIQNMIIQNNYLFIIDAAEDIKVQFNGIHIFYLNFTTMSAFGNWANYIDTFTLDKLSSLTVLSTINSIDVQQAEFTNSFRFFLADSANYLHTVVFQPNKQTFQQYYEIQQSMLITHYLDTEAQKQKNIEFVGIKVFNTQITTTSSQKSEASYNLVLVFKNYHSYETKMQFSTNLIQNILINKYLQNGFYQNQNNFDIIDYNNDGFFILQGMLPQRIVENSTYSSLSKQVLMVYDRTNASLTQTSTSYVNNTIIMATYQFNTMNPFLKFIGQIYPGTVTNYSILAISPVDYSFNNMYVQRNAQFIVNSIDFNDSSLDLILSNDITNAKFTFNVTKEQGQNGTLASSQCVSTKSFSSITLGVSEYYQFKLSDYFEGENLQFTVQPANQTMININSQFTEYTKSGAYGVLNEFNYISILKTVNSSLVAWDNYGVTLSQSNFSNPSYMVTKYLLPTENSPMSIIQPSINFTLNQGQRCYEILYVTADFAVVDCIDMINKVNMFVLVDFSKNKYTIQTQPWLQQLNQSPIWRQLNIMSTKTGMIYIYRTLYQQWYSSEDTPSSSQGYIEVFSFYNGKISELFPFTATTLGLTLLEIQQTWVNQNSLYIYDRLSSSIYKLSPTFQGLVYPQYLQDAYKVPGKFMLFSITTDGTSALIATTVNSINYIYQINWQKKSLTAKYYLNSNINQIIEIFGTSEFIAVEYNNGQRGLKYIGYMDFYEVNAPRVLYQRQISSVEYYLYKPFKNQVMIVYDTAQQQSNYISLWQLTSQSLILSATQAATQQQVTIECSSVYYTINGTQSFRRRALAPAVNISFDFTVEPANSVVINSVSSTAPTEQTLHTQYPGTLAFNLNYYQGPFLQYMIQNTSLPTNTAMQLLQNYQLYSNSQFNFTIGSKTLYPNDVTNFFDQILIEPGVFLWVFQDKSFTTYKELIDIRSGSLKMIDMAAAQQSLSSNLINFQKVFPFVVAFAVQGSPCVMNFVNLDKGYQYTRSFCTVANERIQNFNIFGNYIYIYTTQSNIYTAKLNLTQFVDYSSFQSIQWSQINSQIVDPIVKTQLQTCMPQQLVPYKSNGVYAIKCSASIIIMNLQTLVYYTTITPKSTAAFIPAIVQSYLLLVESTNIEEYNLTSLSNIYKTKDYPTYATSTISYTKVTTCSYYAAIYEANANIIYIVKPGQSIFSVMVSSISVPANVFFMQCMPGVETSILSVISSATGGGAVNIYKLYENYPQFVMDFGAHNTGTNLGAQFQLQVQSSLQQKALSSIKFNTIAINQTELTITANKTQSNDFYSNLINVGYQKDRSYYFDFKQQAHYHGLILNFYINCSVSSECNKTIRMNNVIDWQRTIARTKTFTDVAQGHTGKFAYAQSSHEIWRFLGYMDELYDMVQLPISDPNIYCTKLALNELDQFAVSACSASDITIDFATPIENFWKLYAVSYISTEPFTMGSFYIQAQFINKMIILDKYLFIFDADESIDTYFNGVHVYQFNFDNFTLYPTWYQYVGTLTRDQITSSGQKSIFTSFDVVKTSIAGRYRFVFSTADGYMKTQTYDLTTEQPFANYFEYFTVGVASMLSNYKQANPTLQSVTLFNLQKQTEQSSGHITSQYNALFVFKQISSYEAKITFDEQQQLIHTDFLTEYVQYGYYQSQPNAKIVDDFILFSGVLPEHLLQTAPSTTAKQVLFVYQRNNASGTQITNLQQTQTMATTMVSSGYPFYNSLNQFAYSPQSFSNRTSSKTNYSMLMINPDTNNLDRFWLKQNLSFEFVNNSVKSSSIDLYARNDFMNIYCGKFDISITESPGSSSNHPYWVIGVVLGSVALIAIIVVMYIYYKKKKNASTEGQEPLNEQ